MTNPSTTEIGGASAPRRSGSSGRMTRTAPLGGIEGLLARFGLALEPLLAEVGLPADAFYDPDHRAPVDRMVSLLVRSAERSRCPHFGLLLGEPVQPPALGSAARSLIGALSIERALRGLIMNLHLNGEATVPALTVSIDSACLSITPYAYHAQGAEQMEDFSLAIATNVLRFLGGPKWSPTLLTFAHREPDDRRAYDAFFKAPLRFGAEITSVVFDSAWLTRRPDTSHPMMLEMASGIPTAAARELDVATRARRAVIVCMAQGTVGVDVVASLVGTSKRALNRRLAERGTSTKDLIAEVRTQIAQQLMRDTDLTLADIAATTCYSDVAAFSRAFSARVGLSPAAWKSERRS